MAKFLLIILVMFLGGCAGSTYQEQREILNNKQREERKNAYNPNLTPLERDHKEKSHMPSYGEFSGFKDA